jgi:heptosyltransferase-1
MDTGGCKLNMTEPKKILVIKPSSLGDVIHAMPFLDNLKMIYPDSHISWIISKNLKGIIEGHNLIDEIIIFDKDRWQDIDNIVDTVREVPYFVKKLKKQYFDIVIDLQGLLRTGIITHFARSPVKIGFDDAREGSRYFYDKRIKTDGMTHAVDRYLEAARYLAEKVSVSECLKNRPVRFPLPVDSEAAKRVKNMVSESNGYVLIAPSARWESKTWPPSFFGAIISQLPVDFVIAGSASDRNNAQEVIASSHKKVVDLTGKTNLKELVALISRAQVLVCNDSGPMHIASALGTPVVALFGATAPEKTGPYGWDIPDSRCHVFKADISCSPCFKKTCSHKNCTLALVPDKIIEMVKKYL